MSVNEISLLSESTKDEVVSIDLEYKDGCFKLCADGHTTKLSQQMSRQIIDFVRDLEDKKQDYKTSTSFKMRIKNTGE